MQELLRQVRLAHEAGASYVAVLTALALPDICASLSASNRRTSGAKYRTWCETYLDQFGTPERARALYDFRCSALHQGTLRGQRPGEGPRLLVIPPTSADLMHGGTLQQADGSVAIPVTSRIFLEEMEQGVQSWLADVEDSAIYRSNVDYFVRLHPAGLPPWIVGMPIIG